MSDNTKKIIIVALVLALVSVGAFFYFDHNKQTSKIDLLAEEKQEILAELTNLEEQYDTAIDQNTELSEELVTQRNNIVKFKDSIKQIKSTNWKLIKFYKNKIKNLSSTTDNLFKINDSLAKRNSLLNLENQDLFEQKQDLTKRTQDLSTDLEKQSNFNDTLVQQNLNLAKKVAIAEIVKVNNYKVTTYDERRNGKFRVSDKAKKVNTFKISFLLNENPIAKEKEIIAHIVIKDPSGIVINKKGEFNNNNGNTISFSESTVIPYKTSALATDIIIKSPQKLKKGDYIISIFIDKRQTAVLTKTLK
jgi:hypothetical protein